MVYDILSDIVSKKSENFKRKTKYMEVCKKIVTHKSVLLRQIKHRRKKGADLEKRKERNDMKKRVKQGIGAALIFTFILLFSLSVSASGERVLIAAGTAFGVKFHTNGAIIAGIPGAEGPAYDAGLRRGDIITGLDGKTILSAEEFQKAVKASEGKELTLTYRSGKEEKTARVTPVLDKSGDYKLGLWVKDSAAGIGTITFIDPETMRFVGLGHGICDAESGVLIPLADGTVEEVDLSGITKGAAGAPGELRGSFVGKKLGGLLANRESGVSGILAEVPCGLEKERFPVGDKNEVKAGRAYIFSTVDDDGRGMYEVELSGISKDGTSRNFVVRVTDERLLAKTGGIVQGMSGSPIIQNGKLIGAVTHVLVSDPTKGYGIFIENMMDET